MREPMPVIISRNKEESESTWKANGIYNLPDCMKSNRLTTVVAPLAFTSKKMPSDTQKEANIARVPIAPPALFGNFLQPMPLIRKPINGNKGTKYTKLV